MWYNVYIRKEGDGLNKKIFIIVTIISLSILGKTKTVEYNPNSATSEIQKMEKSGWSVKSVNHINDWSRIIVVYEKSNPTTTLVAYSSNSNLVKEVYKNTSSGWKNSKRNKQ